jgi:hypothetical protein
VSEIEWDEEAIDEALLNSTRIGMMSEKVGLPLLPWQQDAIDRFHINEVLKKQIG